MENNTAGATPEVEIDLVRLFFAFLNRWWVFAAVCTLTTTVAIVYSMFFITPVFKSSITMYVNNRLEQARTDFVSPSDMSASRGLVDTFIAISKSERVMSVVADELKGDYTVGYLKSVVSAEQEGQTELITMTVMTPDPELSARIANTIAEVLPQALSDIVEGSSTKIIDYAKVASKKSSPSNTKNALIGMLIGFVVAAVLVFVEFISDVRIMDEDDLSSVSEYPLLGQIPDFNHIGKRNIRSNKYGYAPHEEASKEKAVGNSTKKAENSDAPSA